MKITEELSSWEIIEYAYVEGYHLARNITPIPALC
jgi:hypothetical protein